MSFKTGDWVVDKIFEQKGRVQYIENIDGIDKYIIEDHKAKYTIDDLTKWQPKENEWCWSKYDGLVQILKITDERYIVFPLSTSEKDCTIEYRLGGLEPFIGELPSFIKDKQ